MGIAWAPDGAAVRVFSRVTRAKASGSGYRAGAAVLRTVLLLVEECRARVSV
jgi:hypothetical protein